VSVQGRGAYSAYTEKGKVEYETLEPRPKGNREYRDTQIRKRVLPAKLPTRVCPGFRGEVVRLHKIPQSRTGRSNR